jgi:HD-like signal output (HDOD) protein
MEAEFFANNLPAIDSPYSRKVAERIKLIPPLPAIASKVLEMIVMEDVDLS